MLNEELCERTPVIGYPIEGEPSELAKSMAQRILGSEERASEVAWPGEMKAKDWGFLGKRPQLTMNALIDHFPEKRKAWTGTEERRPKLAELELPGPVVGASIVKAEVASDEDEAEVAGVATVSGQKAPATPSGVERKRSGGPVQPPAKRARGSASKALQIAMSEELMSEAKLHLADLVYARSTAASKESKGRLFVQIAEARNLQPFPLTPSTVVEMAAVLRAADFSSGIQYIAEAKQLHLRMGHAWDESLDLAYQDADRALGRALGPTKKAAEIRPRLWAEWLEKPREVPERTSVQPSVGPELWGFGTAFLLREVELAHVLMDSVRRRCP